MWFERDSILPTVIPYLYSDWLSYASAVLATAGIETPKLDAEYLLAFITGFPRLELRLHSSRVLTSRQHFKLSKLLGRRENREPLQYILGSVDFYGLHLHVSRSVLIPRNETELLVQSIIRENPQASSILDLGTGSGAIALALKKNLPNSSVTASDISARALKIANGNASKLHLEVRFCKSDVLTQINGRFDVIVSNPPYLSEDEYEATLPEVRDFEPKKALVADHKGLAIYEKILRDANNHLKRKGRIYFEIGYMQGNEISFLAQKYGFTSMEIKQDYNGFDRFFIIRT